jgi:hypothetical protein
VGEEEVFWCPTAGGDVGVSIECEWDDFDGGIESAFQFE